MTRVIDALDSRTCNIMLTSKLTQPYCDRLEPKFEIKYGEYGSTNHQRLSSIGETFLI